MVRRKAKTLAEIAERMAGLARDGTDQEADHSIADDLLVQAVLLVGGKDGKRIVNEYDAVAKWYA